MVKLKRIFTNTGVLSLLITVFIVLTLIFVGSSPAQAVNFTIGQPSTTGTVGSSYQFSVQVNLDKTVNDKLTINRVDLVIYNTADSSKTATLSDLPLQSVSAQAHNPQEGSTSGSALVTVVTGPAWGYAQDTNRYGYGYGYPSGPWQSITLGPASWGYGYSSAPYTESTWIKYTVAWTSPGGWAGTYEIKPIVYMSDGTSPSNGFVQPSPLNSFTLAAAAAAAAAESVETGGPAPEPVGTLDVSDIVNYQGVFTESATVESDDETVQLTIDEGTTGLTKEGEPIKSIDITWVEPPAPPIDVNVIGMTYDFGPDGATFDPPIDLTFTYDPADIPFGVNEEDLVLAFWDEDAGDWVVLEDVTIDPATNTISASVSHFTYFTVIAYGHPAVFTASDLTITPAEVYAGEGLNISVVIKNAGDLSGSHKITLKINDIVTAYKIVTIAGHSTEKVTFGAIKGVVGSYKVNVNGLLDEFTVTPVPTEGVTITAPAPAPVPPAPAPPAPPVPAPAPPAPPAPAPVPAPAPAPVPWLLFVVVAVPTVIVVGVVIWLFEYRSM